MRPILPLILAAAPAAVPAAALAATDAEWAAFRADVESACLALVADHRGEPRIEVNPWGSESYAAAILTLVAEGETDRMICIYDKATGAAEITQPWTTLAE